MGSTLLLGFWFFKRNFLRVLMSAQLELPDPVWNVLLHAWSAFFAVMGCVNLWVAYNFDTDTWVSFKLFGGLGLMFVFLVLQGLYISRYLPEDKPEDGQA
jgi:intracellular septation protein